MEEYIWGVYASKELAEVDCTGGSVDYKAHRYDDGDVYLYSADGFRAFVIQPHAVQYRLENHLTEQTCGSQKVEGV